MDLIVEMKGISPLLMHNPRLADPEDDIVQLISQINSKQKKTKEDRREREHLEFIGGLYMNHGRPVVPAINIRKCWMDAGKANRGESTAVGRSVLLSQVDYPLEYDGPTDPEELWRTGQHFRTIVALNPGRKNGGRGPRVRPMFMPWRLTINLTLITELFDLDRFKNLVSMAGVIEGLGEGRAVGMGRYDGAVKEA